MTQLSDYTSLITAEHADKPNFVATVESLIQGFIDCNNVISTLPSRLDLDSSVGQQLDFLGQWIGLSRTLRVPLTGIFFSFDTSGLGFDQGTIDGPPNAFTGLISLDDDTFRQMLYLQVAANNWDGSMADAEQILAEALATSNPNAHVFIEDNMDMSMSIGVTGSLPSALFQQLLANGYFNLRPAAVQISGVSVGAGPFFGFDVENYNISGFDVGVIT